MSTLTREQLRERARGKVKKLEYAITQSAFTAIREGLEEELDLARIALASLESEPVSEFYHEARWGWYEISEGDKVPERSRIPLYRVPPAPVSVPTFDEWLEIRGNKPLGWVKDAMRESYDACRAAMLQGAEPVSNRDELPLDYLQGHKDGLEWAAQLAEANHPHTGDWLYDDPIELAKAIRKGPDMPEFAGNSPVIPDGWVACSERLPEGMQTVITSNGFDIGQGWWDGEGWNSFDSHDVVPGDVTHWQPLPSPPLK